MKDNYLRGKNVLLISYSFYDYHKAISDSIRSKGATVFYVDTYVSSKFGPLNQILLGLSKKRKLDFVIKNRIKNIDANIDIVFVININIMSDSLFEWIFNRYGKACKILYLWDSMSHSRYTPALLQKFDKIFSFDPYDCKQYGFTFLPLFFRNYTQSKQVLDYDFAFVGVARNDRYKLTKFIADYCKQNNLKCFIYLYFRSRLFYLYRKIVRKEYPGSTMKDFRFEKMSKEDLDSIVSSTKIVIDAEMEGQSGLTMRTIECHGAHKKMITTNKEVKNYDFYHKDNFYIIDKNNLAIDESFINSDYHVFSENIYSKYSLNHWIDVLFGDFCDAS